MVKAARATLQTYIRKISRRQQSTGPGHDDFENCRSWDMCRLAYTLGLDAGSEAAKARSCDDNVLSLRQEAMVQISECSMEGQSQCRLSAF